MYQKCSSFNACERLSGKCIFHTATIWNVRQRHALIEAKTEKEKLVTSLFFNAFTDTEGPCDSPTGWEMSLITLRQIKSFENCWLCQKCAVMVVASESRSVRHFGHLPWNLLWMFVPRWLLMSSTLLHSTTMRPKFSLPMFVPVSGQFCTNNISNWKIATSKTQMSFLWHCHLQSLKLLAHDLATLVSVWGCTAHHTSKTNVFYG